MLAGLPFGCTSDSASGGAGPDITDEPDPTTTTVAAGTITTATTAVDDTVPPPQPTQPTQPPVTTAGVAYRLSTRNQRAPCKACKAHAAHRYFATAEIAGASRAHPGCACAVVANPVAAEQLHTWFDANDIFDDRWGG